MLKTILTRFVLARGGATAIEYGLICSLIVLVIVVGIGAVGRANNNKYNAISGAVSGAM